MPLFHQMFGLQRNISSFARKHLYYCDRAGYICQNPNFSVNREYLNDYLLLYVVSGLFHVDCESYSQAVKPGETILINLKEPHRYYSDSAKACEILWIDFNCSDEKLSFLTSLYTLPHRVSAPEIQPLMHQFVTEYVHNSQFSEIQQSEKIYQLLLVLLEKQHNTGLVNSTYTEVEAYIRQHLRERITLKQLADLQHLSVYHFCRQFKKHYRQTPMQYILRQRMERAVYLLAYSSLSVTEIAAELGFYSQSHLSVTFKKNAGSYPTEYRQTLLSQMRGESRKTDP